LSHNQVSELLRPEAFVGPKQPPTAIRTPE
jgi:hypothetical protein